MVCNVYDCLNSLKHSTTDTWFFLDLPVFFKYQLKHIFIWLNTVVIIYKSTDENHIIIGWCTSSQCLRFNVPYIKSNLKYAVLEVKKSILCKNGNVAAVVSARIIFIKSSCLKSAAIKHFGAL